MTATRRRGAAASALFLALAGLAPGPAAAQPTADQQAAEILNAGRKAYADANPQFAAEKFREFLTKFGNSSMRRTEFTTSILQALALMNGNFVADATSSDLQRSVTLSGLIDAPFMNNSQRVETLFLATLSRPPRANEAQRLVVARHRVL